MCRFFMLTKRSAQGDEPDTHPYKDNGNKHYKECQQGVESEDNSGAQTCHEIVVWEDWRWNMLEQPDE